ncbi:MAG TPA: hypothetical protein VM848_14925 [Acidimicrobiia bacterium]|nr:hypothetical protein [Acidimicrobiia bacterium]
MNEGHPLHAIPHDLVGRAIKDPLFRNEILALKEDEDALNQFLVEKGYAPIGHAAYLVIHGLDKTDVDRVLGEVSENNDFLAS